MNATAPTPTAQFFAQLHIFSGLQIKKTDNSIDFELFELRTEEKQDSFACFLTLLILSYLN